jgi:hypothetical protein
VPDPALAKKSPWQVAPLTSQFDFVGAMFDEARRGLLDVLAGNDLG